MSSRTFIWWLSTYIDNEGGYFFYIRDFNGHNTTTIWFYLLIMKISHHNWKVNWSLVSQITTFLAYHRCGYLSLQLWHFHCYYNGACYIHYNFIMLNHLRKVPTSMTITTCMRKLLFYWLQDSWANNCLISPPLFLYSFMFWSLVESYINFPFVLNFIMLNHLSVPIGKCTMPFLFMDILFQFLERRDDVTEAKERQKGIMLQNYTMIILKIFKLVDCR